MNTPRKPAADNPAVTRRGEAGGQSQPLRRGDNDSQRAKQKLDDVGLQDRGEVFEDEQRDRGSSGRPPEPPEQGATRH